MDDESMRINGAVREGTEIKGENLEKEDLPEFQSHITRKARNPYGLDRIDIFAPKKDEDDILTRQLPKIPCDEKIKEYFKSKCNEPEFQVKKPEWDMPQNNPVAKFIKANRELEQAKQKKDEKLREEVETKKDISRRWEELRMKEDALQKLFIDFEDFIKENEGKRKRAENKIAEETDIQKNREKEINDLNETIERIDKIKHMFEESVIDYKMYEDYLYEVIDISEFESVTEIHNRYETLLAARDELMNKQAEDLQLLEKARITTIQMTQDKAQAVVTFKNELALMKDRLESLKAATISRQAVLQRIIQTGAARVSGIGEARESAWCMHKKVCEELKHPVTAKRDDMKQQMLAIKMFMRSLEEITNTAKLRTWRERPEHFHKIK